MSEEKQPLNYQEINRQTVNQWVADGWEWGQPIGHAEYQRVAQGGVPHLVLSPTKPVPAAWYPDLHGKKVLGLASGGGQQGPLLTALGADVTIIDYADTKIQAEQLVAQREGYDITAIQGDVTKRLPFADEAFDLIVHPVANVYFAQVQPVWQEAFRVLKHGGALWAGLDNSINFLVDGAEERIINALPFDPLKNPDQMAQLQADDSGVQFSHGIDEQIGGQLKAGFQLLDVYDDINSSGRLAKLNIPTFWVTRAVKP
ncbi:class I SAM-dependent methyltransferase [Schleiferilactobacillus harbinensis]|uniref:class I SAM-dependent methyltransferase n=1 Tax=Schleiferilactobacillus harbinensis TaxID=304207 RepID=UPI0039E818B0